MRDRYQLRGDLFDAFTPEQRVTLVIAYDALRDAVLLGRSEYPSSSWSRYAAKRTREMIAAFGEKRKQ